MEKTAAAKPITPVSVVQRLLISNSSKRNPLKPFLDVSDYLKFFDSLSCDVSTYKMERFISAKELFSGKLFSLNHNEIINRVESYTDLAVITSK